LLYWINLANRRP